MPEVSLPIINKHYFINKADALKGTIDTIRNHNKFKFISRHPNLSEPVFNELLTRSIYQEESQEQIAEELREVKQKICKRAEILNVKPNFNVQAVKMLEDKLASFKNTSMPANYEQYRVLLEEYTSRVHPLEFKLFRTLRKLQDFNRILREHEWYDRYMDYALIHSIDVDDENMYRICNRHRINQLIEEVYGPNAEVDIDDAVDLCIGFIHSEDPEIFTSRK